MVSKKASLTNIEVATQSRRPSTDRRALLLHFISAIVRKKIMLWGAFIVATRLFIGITARKGLQSTLRRRNWLKWTYYTF